jgi:hypothetical protein
LPDSLGDASPQIVETHDATDTGFDPVTISTDEDPAPVLNQEKADYRSASVPASTYQASVSRILPSVLDEI